MAALDMKRSVVICIPEDKTTWSELVGGIILDYFASIPKCAFEFIDADVTDNGLINRVFRELVLSPTDLTLNFSK
jgi:hypothetical protein